MSVVKGIAVGAANVAVVAVVVGAATPLASAVDIGFIGGLPGLLAGAAIGWLAGRTARLRPPVRVALLAIPAFLLVFWLAHVFTMLELAELACVPTTIAAIVLERWTRRPPIPPPIPVVSLAS
jgi:ABC-type dipeptide/oligopeptide/nickel transport system permease subunit